MSVHSFWIISPEVHPDERIRIRAQLSPLKARNLMVVVVRPNNLSPCGKFVIGRYGDETGRGDGLFQPDELEPSESQLPKALQIVAARVPHSKPVGSQRCLAAQRITLRQPASRQIIVRA